MKKILVGMSGGVDSSVAALMLKLNGYDVDGCTLNLCGREIVEDKFTRSCCSIDDVSDARSVCCKLGLEHFVFNFKDLFREKVIDEFVQSYIAGETPNPCISCNRYIKFDKLLARAVELGYDGIATGHYAWNYFNEKTGRYNLNRPTDRQKDQTYVLYNLTQYQLEHTLFPLWDTNKSKNRALAEEYGLLNARKPDSQDICFVPDGDYAKFIEEYSGLSFPQGDFTDTDGNVIGRHSGIINYTIGQRKGLGVTFGKPVFVCGKDAEKNTVILGDSDKLMSRTVIAEDVNLISIADLSGEMRVTAKTRYNMPDVPAVLTRDGDSRIRVTFDEPVRAAAKGQALVVYDGETVVGGGKIVAAE